MNLRIDEIALVDDQRLVTRRRQRAVSDEQLVEDVEVRQVAQLLGGFDRRRKITAEPVEGRRHTGVGDVARLANLLVNRSGCRGPEIADGSKDRRLPPPADLPCRCIGTRKLRSRACSQPITSAEQKPLSVIR